MITNKKSKILSIVDVLYLVCILWLNAGVMRFGGYINSTLLLVFFFLGLLINHYINLNRIIESGIVWGIVFLLSILPSSFLVYHGFESEVSETIYAIIILTIAEHIRKRPDKIRRFFILCFMIDSIIINLNTVFILSTSKNIARIYASGSAAVVDAGFDYFLLAGYGYIYALVIAIVIIATCFPEIRKQPRFFKVIIYMYTLTGLALIIKAEYTIALISTIVGIPLAIITRYKIDPRTVLLTIFFGIIGLFSLEWLLNIAIDTNLFGPFISERFNEILYALNGNTSSASDLSSRLYLYEKTLRAIPAHLIFGVYEYGVNGRYLIGYHTEWPDRLALFGLRYFVYCVFLYKSLKFSLNKISYKLFAGMLCFIVIGFVNPIITQEFYLVLLFFIPLLFETDSGVMLDHSVKTLQRLKW